MDETISSKYCELNRWGTVTGQQGILKTGYAMVNNNFNKSRVW